jgi:hypothetical protein
MTEARISFMSVVFSQVLRGRIVTTSVNRGTVALSVELCYVNVSIIAFRAGMIT